MSAPAVHFRRVADAYRRVFREEKVEGPWWLRLLVRLSLTTEAAYQKTLDGMARQIVVADLARFCHALDTTHVIGDTHATAQLEGRRQVWLKIQSNIHLNEERLRAYLDLEAQG